MWSCSYSWSYFPAPASQEERASRLFSHPRGSQLSSPVMGQLQLWRYHACRSLSASYSWGCWVPEKWLRVSVFESDTWLWRLLRSVIFQTPFMNQTKVDSFFIITILSEVQQKKKKGKISVWCVCVKVIRILTALQSHFPFPRSPLTITLVLNLTPALTLT